MFVYFILEWQKLQFSAEILFQLFRKNYLVVDQTVTSTHPDGWYNIFFVLQVLKTHFDCFNSLVNNLDDMERQQLFFVDFGKIKSLVIIRRGNLWTKISIQQISYKTLANH